MKQFQVKVMANKLFALHAIQKTSFLQKKAQHMLITAHMCCAVMQKKCCIS